MKKCYDVYIEETMCFDNIVAVMRTYAGRTLAVSEKEAVDKINSLGKKGVNGYNWRLWSYIALPHGTKIATLETMVV
jgi:hypothetical protein